MSRIDNDHWAVGIRGFADQFSKSMLVMVDGRSLYTPLFAGVYWALQDGIFLKTLNVSKSFEDRAARSGARTRSPV